MPTIEEVERAKQNAMIGSGYLHIRFVPSNTAREFMDFASNQAEFNKDWGMAFKHIWDVYKGLVGITNHELSEKIRELDARVEQLERPVAQEEEKPQYRQMADGTKVRL
jgi:uncharacterized membrane protein YfbV (UPF0208 family)